MHPHLAAGEFDLLGGGDGLSVYSLGNFLFDQSSRRASSAILEPHLGMTMGFDVSFSQHKEAFLRKKIGSCAVQTPRTSVQPRSLEKWTQIVL